MKNETMWAIRDARGLSQDEKSLLWAIESRGVAVTRWSRLAEDAGMKKDRFYRTRKSLQEKRLILSVRKYDDVSEYTVNLETLRMYLPDSHSANEDSHSENGHSHSANPQLHMSETKRNMKKNEQEKLEEEQTTGRPVVSDESGVRERFEPSSNYKDVPPDLPNVGSRDAAQPRKREPLNWDTNWEELYENKLKEKANGRN